MAVPKRRRSKAKKRTHRAAWKIEAPHLRPCPFCGSHIQTHRACINCGQYKGRQVIKIKSKQKETEKE